MNSEFAGTLLLFDEFCDVALLWQFTRTARMSGAIVISANRVLSILFPFFICLIATYV
jgi:hypothetical protein